MEILAFNHVRVAAVVIGSGTRLTLRVVVSATCVLAGGRTSLATDPEEPDAADRAWLAEPVTRGPGSKDVMCTAGAAPWRFAVGSNAVEVNEEQPGSIPASSWTRAMVETAVRGKGEWLASPRVRAHAFLWTTRGGEALALMHSRAHFDRPRGRLRLCWRGERPVTAHQLQSRLILIADRADEPPPPQEVERRTDYFRSDLVLWRGETEDVQGDAQPTEPGDMTLPVHTAPQMSPLPFFERSGLQARSAPEPEDPETPEERAEGFRSSNPSPPRAPSTHPEPPKRPAAPPNPPPVPPPPPPPAPPAPAPPAAGALPTLGATPLGIATPKPAIVVHPAAPSSEPAAAPSKSIAAARVANAEQGRPEGPRAGVAGVSAEAPPQAETAKPLGGGEGAKARAEVRPTSTAPASKPAGLELLWHHEDALDQLRHSPELRALLPKVKSPEQADERPDRVELLALLEQGPASDPRQIAFQRSADRMRSKLVLARGSIEPELDEIALLRATAAACTPLRKHHARIEEAVAEIFRLLDEGHLEEAPAVAAQETTRLLDTLQSVSREELVSSVKSAAVGALIRARKYAFRELHGERVVRARLHDARPEPGSASHLTLYLPEDGARHLPLFRSLPALVLARVHPPLEENEEQHALWALALARDLDRSSADLRRPAQGKDRRPEELPAFGTTRPRAGS